ncbi:MAG TPA: hypothetical protein VIF12_06375 [Micavibrio sp.]|jgi:hypothetical protein
MMQDKESGNSEWKLGAGVALLFAASVSCAMLGIQELDAQAKPLVERNATVFNRMRHPGVDAKTWPDTQKDVTYKVGAGPGFWVLAGPLTSKDTTGLLEMAYEKGIAIVPGSAGQSARLNVGDGYGCAVIDPSAPIEKSAFSVRTLLKSFAASGFAPGTYTLNASDSGTSFAPGGKTADFCPKV